MKSERKRKWYVGRDKAWTYRAFSLAYRPTERKQGRRWVYVIGPFRTKRAALWVERFGELNPHFRSVEDAEQLARLFYANRPVPTPAAVEGPFIRK